MAFESIDNRKYGPDKSVSVDYPSDNLVKIISDEPSSDASDFKSYAKKLSEFIVNSTPRFTVGIYGGWGTGKTTLMHMIKNELEINHRGIVETIWFDSWRYEREKYSAMVPLLRTIILGIKDGLEEMANSDLDKKKKVLSKLVTTFSKVGNAVLRNTSAEIGLSAGDVLEAGANIDINKMIDDYKSDGSFIIDQERVYFHKHISDHLKDEFHRIRYDEKDRLIYDFRLIIFIDDLDRCTPEKALELLESIKTFFDIEGIIYVIGMDPRTIDPIIRTKYGESGKIDGMEYLQKIVQLPFQIPVWGFADISKTVRNMISKTGMPEKDIQNILEGTNIELIIKAAQLNPRDVKRFINTLILSKVIYGQSSKDFEKLIAIQAFFFRGNKWIDFLKLMIPYKTRIEFLKSFIISSDSGKLSSLEDLSKLIDDSDTKKSNVTLERPIMEIYKKLSELNDSDLFLFLKTSASTLIKIDVIERYLRAVDTINVSDRGQIYSDTEMLLALLRNGNVTEFNKIRYQKTSLIHLPYENMGPELRQGEIKKTYLPRVNLKEAFLFKTDFSLADLSSANLSLADLSFADLSSANLSRSNLRGADLSQVNLNQANLHAADLSWSYLPGANLRGADLVGADLPMADLRGADLSGANLSEANLSNAKLQGAFLVEANLHGAFLSEADFLEADLSGANLSKANLFRAYLSKANLSKAKLEGIDNFKELKINETKFDNTTIDNILFLEYIQDKKNGAINAPEGS